MTKRKREVFFGNPEFKMRECLKEMQPLHQFFCEKIPGFEDLKEIDREMEKKMESIDKEKYQQLRELDNEKTDLILEWPFHFQEMREKILKS